MTMNVAVRLSDEPLDPADCLSRVSDDRAGATTVFIGTVRDHSDGRAGVTKLVYDAYTEHVESSLLEIASEAGDRWPILQMVVEHRTGEVGVGEPSVVVAVATPHRSDAFEAAKYVIDELKRRSPIWKQEHWPGGAEWIEGA